jgi:hypothetical protein
MLKKIDKDNLPYEQCGECKTLDDCKHKDLPLDEVGLPMPPDACPKAIEVMRRTLNKRKFERYKNLS